MKLRPILLTKGLFFCPTPRHLNKTEILDDLESYFRRLRLKEYFLDAQTEGEDNDAETSFRTPSTWMSPKGRDAALETYIKRVRTDIELQLTKRQASRSKRNLLCKERAALRDLR